MSIIQSIDVKKWYGDFQALKGITMDVAEGEVLVICGPSGSGKSTFIRCINRLEQHQDGQIIVDGIELTNDLKNIEAIRSEVGMVFQSFNLFPHLTVLQNLMVPLKLRRMSTLERFPVINWFLPNRRTYRNDRILYTAWCRVYF